MRLLIVLCFVLTTIINIQAQEQSIETIYDFSSKNDSVLIYSHLETSYPEIDKKLSEYPTNNIFYMSPNEVLIDHSSNTMTIEGGDYSLIEIRAKSELIETSAKGGFLFRNKVPIKMETDFDLLAFMWIFPEDVDISDYSCNSEGNFSKRNNALIFTAKKVNDLQFKIFFNENQCGTLRSHPINSDTIISHTIYYNSGIWKHNSKDQEELRQLVNEIKILKNYKILISGHTSKVPLKSNKTNWELSAQRSTDIVNSLINLGINEKFITASFHSSIKTNSKNNNQDAQNRRVDIFVINDCQEK